MGIIELLIDIQGIFQEWTDVLDNYDEFLEDQERYLKIAMKIEPKSPAFIGRNANANVSDVGMGIAHWANKEGLRRANSERRISNLFANRLFHSQ